MKAKSTKPLNVYRVGGYWHDERANNRHNQATFVCAAASKAAFLRTYPDFRNNEIVIDLREPVKELARTKPGALFALGLTNWTGCYVEVTDLSTVRRG